MVVFAELALGLGLALGFLTPIAAFAAIVLNLMYFILMISDWAEQGQNLMMILAEVVILGTHAGTCGRSTTCSTGWVLIEKYETVSPGGRRREENDDCIRRCTSRT